MGYQAALIALSIIAILLLVPPLIWHIKTVNIPAITLIIWLLLMDLKVFIDAIIWGGDGFADRFSGDGYCDVMVKLQVGAGVGISSSVAAIMFNLYRILKADSVIPGLRSFKKIAVDLTISLLTPIIVMGLNYLVQARRFYVFKYSGCQNIMAPSYVTILVCTMWLLIWSLIGVIYAILIILKFFKKRKDVKDILKCTNSGLNLVRFAKLLMFCCVVILVMFPISIYIFVCDIFNVDGSYNFKKIHSPAVWDTVSFVPLKEPPYTVWIYIAISYIVFIFFGLGTDAIEMYLSFLEKIGFTPVIEYVREKRERRRILKADEMVSKALKTTDESTINSSFSGTAFDIELEQMMNEETPTSNVFSDRHIISSDENNYYSSSSKEVFRNEFNPDFELDEDDVQYLKILYQSKDIEMSTNENTSSNWTLVGQDTVNEEDCRSGL